MPAKMSGVTLSELVKYTASELRKVKQESPKDGLPVMQFKECELELKVTISAEGGGGIKFWIITAGANVSKETVWSG
jgi:Trypsin-co-occurring domain 2